MPLRLLIRMCTHGILPTAKILMERLRSRLPTAKPRALRADVIMKRTCRSIPRNAACSDSQESRGKACDSGEESVR